jgi:chromosome segregation protein
MIFSGSDQRPRAGMASATITFDNSDGWLPIDFSEVSVTRRAYRDGDNEYLLNGQRVRLKDIAELLAQSGLAERTYTIIGQGLVDAALSLKPEERRKFFEEAAGIGLYRSRREEALTRLETTRRNMERVQDILGELGPRIASLEKQAKKVIEYERIKADLRILLRDWYGYHWHNTQKELQHAQEVLKAQEKRLNAAREQQEKADITLSLARQEMQKQRDVLNTWHTQSSGLHEQWEKVSRTMAVMDERQIAFQSQLKNHNADMMRLEEEEKALLSRLEQVEKEVVVLQSDLSDAQQQVDQAKQSIKERDQERARLEKDLREARQQQVGSETRQVQQRAHLDEVNHRLETLNKSIEGIRASVAGAEQAVRDAEEKLKASVQKRDALISKQQTAEKNLAVQKQKIADLEEERKEAAQQQSGLQAEYTRLKVQMDVLEEADRSLSGVNQGTQNLIEAAKSGKLAGRYTAFNQLVEVQAEYETAVAAVLGDYLDSVLLENSADLEQALQYLEEGQKGKAVLFSIDSARNSPPVDLKGEVDALCVASAVAKVADGKLHGLIEALLGQVVIVKDRKDAQRLIKRLPLSSRVVTLRGEVFLGDGAVIAGQVGKVNLIARPRQKRELKEKLDDVQSRLEKITRRIEKLGNQAQTEMTRQHEFEGAVKAANQESLDAGREHQRLTLEMEQARQKRDWQVSQIKTLESQIASAEDEVGFLEAEINKLSQRITEASTVVKKINRELLDLPMEEIQSQLVHWNTSVAVATRSLLEVQKRNSEYLQTRDSNSNRKDGLQQQIDQIHTGLQQLEQERNQLHQRGEELDEQINILQAQITPAEQVLEAKEKELNSHLSNQQTAQQALAVADRYHTQAQLELSRQREALESLRRRIEDDFGLVAFEYVNDVSGQTPLPFEGMVDQLPALTEITPEIEENISRQRAQLRRMGPVNLEAQREYQEVSERFEFLTDQTADLNKAESDLREVIAELDELMRKEFKRTFNAVASEFKVLFTRLFGGGSARLLMTDEDNPTETGIDIIARLPGRREQGLSLLSGGERSLTAVALVFSLLKVSPTPFCVMDEVDAMLDEANVGRFTELLKELGQNTQFIVITHNRNTVQTADVIYGITMGRDSASQVISLRLDEVSEEMVH